jgi:hypothetical protein
MELIIEHTQTNKQTNKQTKQTHKQTNKQTNKTKPYKKCLDNISLLPSVL